MSKSRGKAARRLRRHRRVRRKVYGTPERPRLCVFRSLKHIYAQVIDDVTGRTLASASTVMPDARARCTGAKKTEAAALVGNELARRAVAAGVEKVAFDRAGYKYHGRVKALADGAREGGLKF